MKLHVVKLGRVAYPELRSLAGVYEERLGAYAKVSGEELKDPAAPLARVRRESGAGHLVVALDERGKEWSSTELAQRLQGWADDPGVKSVTFVIGGPLGLSPEIAGAADHRWSLSRATLTSDIAWLVVWEQLYRGFNILKGTGYHHE